MHTAYHSRQVAATALMAALLFLIHLLPAARAQVNFGIGNLALGESVTITFDVTINSPLSVAVTQLSAQGTVSGDNFTTVSTDDPETIAANDPTITPLSQDFDFGDAPDPLVATAGRYPTLLANNGARHFIPAGGAPLFLGSNPPDAETDGQPNATATGDGADEDGVTPPASFAGGSNANVTVAVTGSGNLNAWIDWNQDGDWDDAGERIFTDLALTAAGNPHTLSVAVPASVTHGPTFVRFRFSTNSGLAPTGTAADGEVEDYSVNVIASVVGRGVFYNRSAWDGNDQAPNALDDAAIAPDKSALLPGGTATFANYTSYHRGLNGVMVDIAGLLGTPGAGDFSFKMGNNSSPGTWAGASAPASITVRPGAGAGGSARVTLIWNDNNLDAVADPNEAVIKQWLEVTVLATANTGLAAPHTFYFGNAVGEAGNSVNDAKVDPADELLARAHPSNFLNALQLIAPGGGGLLRGSTVETRLRFSLEQDGRVRIELRGQPGPPYILQRVENLAQGRWQAVSASVSAPARGGPVHWLVPPAGQHAFFRVVLAHEPSPPLSPE